MEFQIEWLLVLPLFFALGWAASRWDAKHQARQSEQLPKSYFKGLHHLLEHEPDQAIDALIDVARVDTGAVDLYFALGHLFEQRGEVERGIRVYQSLLTRPDLLDEARLEATYRLGRAFLSGGLFDRAEACFKQLLNTRHNTQAQTQLLHIYQSQQEWTQAIAVAQVIRQAAPTDSSVSTLHAQQQLDRARSHFHCELAQTAINTQQWVEARAQIEQARGIRPESIRAAVLQGQWHAAQGDHEAALNVYQTLAMAQPEAAPLACTQILEAYVAQHRAADGVDYLYAQAKQSGSIDILAVWLAAQQKYAPDGAIEPRLTQLFAAHPSLFGLNQLIQCRLAHAPSAIESAADEQTQHHEYRLTSGLIHKHIKQLSKYRCTHCGFEATHYYWQCPACTRWESYPPKRLEELQNTARTRNNSDNY